MDDQVAPQLAMSLQRSTQPYASVFINLSTHCHPRDGNDFHKESGEQQAYTQPYQSTNTVNPTYSWVY